MEPLGATSSIIAILHLSSEVVKYVRTAANATKERQALLKELRACESVLRALVDETEDQYEGQRWLQTIRTLEAPDAPLGILKATLTTIKQDLQPKAGLKSKVKVALAWPFKQQDVEKLIDLIERQVQLLDIALANDTRRLVQEIKKANKETTSLVAELSEHMNNTSQGVADVQDAIDNLQLSQDEEKLRHERREILDWLSPLDYTAQQNDFFARRQEGTGQWLLDSPEFQQWKTTKGQTLFCPGIPGAGKTMAISIAVDHLESTRNSDAGLAYIYCNFRRQDDPDQLLAALLKKLSGDKWDSARPILKHIYGRHKGNKGSDALDEYRNPDGRLTRFLNALFALQASSGANVLATSRPIPDITRVFDKATILEVRASPKDIGHYIDGHISELPRCVRTNPELQAEIKTAIVESVKGMFLLAQLHLDSLKDKLTKKAVRNALARLPTGSSAYDESYAESMKRIGGQLPDQAKFAKEVLTWISLSRRPLEVRELQDALATELEEPEIDPDNIPDPDDIVSVCLGLVTIDEESRIIRLVHYTVQEYFERTHQTWFPGAQGYMSAVCISYLSIEACPETGVFGWGVTLSQGSTVRRYPFYMYAAQYWSHHCRYEPISEALMSFLASPRNSSLATSAVHKDNPEISPFYRATGAHLVAGFGLQSAIAPLLSRKVDMRRETPKAGIPYLWPRRWAMLLS